MKKLKKYRGLLVSLILAIVTVLIIHQYISSLETAYEGTGPREIDGEDQVAVVVATSNLDTGTILTQDHLDTRKVPEQTAHPQAVTDKEEITGEVLKQDVVEHEVLMSSRVLGEEEANKLSEVIPENKRAMSVAVDQVSGVAGFIQAGDYVDVVATKDEEDREGQEPSQDSSSEIILDNLQVLAVGDRILYSRQELVQEVSTVTLAVNRNEATELTHAEEEHVIRLLLQPITEN
ncbi:Flp pilus assembly protein CpaB [Natranaerobius thermophilus]|uniref:Flp pilus assembly protein CpaB n=1 Tax=Natranaerobius thermophilus (strain ATCC BAA-1301 / DSM 18059 / JW/NM-WN-LF) TaxID=457570 RepID=B2A8J9_NATTJ|nr:Flp pilus assembly protein CpaB [Natranaerobius thermophilus]ACB85883.1 Flp pilus assembly protein CpaB [Natranaerobius thermophilus JW/NM-WN-LF]